MITSAPLWSVLVVPAVLAGFAAIAVLPRLLAGTELAAARLIIASLDPDLDQLPALMEGGMEGDGH